MMVELLTGGLMGDLFSYEAGQQDNADGGPPPGGELILAFDPARFGDAPGTPAGAHASGAADVLCHAE